MHRKIMGVIGAAIVAVTLVIWGPTNPAGAKPRPGPTITTKTYRPIKPRPVTTPASVWVTAEPGLGMAAGIYATGFWNPRTGVTDFTGELTPDGLGWAHTACPSPAYVTRQPCLRVVWANMAEGVSGSYESVYCAGSCYRQGLIKVNRWGPYFCDPRPVEEGGNACPYEPTWGYENPWNRGTIVTHFFGRFIGLAGHPTRDCTSIMSASAWTCAPPRAGDDWLTDAEAAAVAVW